MIPIRQRLKHDPAAGVWGDCHRACVASVLGLPLEEVPHFCEGGPSPEEFQTRERAFLLSRGLVPITVAYQGELGAVLRTSGVLNQDTYHLLGGMSTTGVPHSVVCLDGEVVHNPNDAAIVGPLEDDFYYVTYFGAAAACRPRT